MRPSLARERNGESPKLIVPPVTIVYPIDFLPAA